MIGRLALAMMITSIMIASTSAGAFQKGDSCKLKAPLSLSIRGAAGTVESTIERGTPVEIVSVSDEGFARIIAGELKGTVALVDLEGACAGTLRLCKLSSAVMMYEQNRSDSKSWKLKPGADVSVLKKGKTWAAVRVNDLQGFVKADEITAACAASKNPALDDIVSDDVVGTEGVERGEGPGLLLPPFHIEGAVPLGRADALLETLFDRLASYRPDAARVPADGSPRNKAWKELVIDAAKRARGADTEYALVGRLALEAVKVDPAAPAPAAPTSTSTERLVLELGIVDGKSGKVMKAVRARPTSRIEDNWADRALGALLPVLPSAPGSKLPEAAPQLEIAPVPQAPDAPAPTAPTGELTASAPWFANVWGYAALGGALALGAGSGVLGSFALDENARANAAAQTDPARGASRSTALTQAIAADALGVAAAGAAVASVVVFATRAGLD